ncbi:hypothetical protein V8C26DRAFT_69644 [Trichoderma gracile]
MTVGHYIVHKRISANDVNQHQTASSDRTDISQTLLFVANKKRDADNPNGRAGDLFHRILAKQSTNIASWPELVPTLVPYDFMSLRKRKELSLAGQEPCRLSVCTPHGEEAPARMCPLYQRCEYGAHVVADQIPGCGDRGVVLVVHTLGGGGRTGLCNAVRPLLNRVGVHVACWHTCSSGCASSEPEERLVMVLELLGLCMCLIPPGQPHDGGHGMYEDFLGHMPGAP